MLTTLVLAAGESRRFAEHYGESYPPKQFLEFRPTRSAEPAQMWENVTHSLTISSRFYAAFQHRHARWLRDSRRQPTAYVWLMPTRGQADTLLQALQRIPAADELLVVNCDNGFGHGVLNRLVHEGRYHHTVAALTREVSSAPGSVKRWSFVDGHPTFHGAVERRMLSPFALMGAYYFPHVDEALHAAERVVDNAYEITHTSFTDRKTIEPGISLREPYVSEMFRWMPESKLSVDIESDDFHDWGTPDALQNFLKFEINR